MAVDIITPGGDKNNATLAAFLQQEEGDHLADDSSSAQIITLPDVDKKMADEVPSHMVPSIYFSLSELPLMPSGKIDRKRLREIGASFSVQQLADLRASISGEKRQPSTEVERMMQNLWARTLNIKPETIGLDDSFFRLGGDSITAMQLSASARSVDLHFSTRDIFQKKTIAELVRTMTSSKALSWEDPVDTLFGLSPVQELYLQLEPTGKANFDQSVLLELRSHVTIDEVLTAFQTLVRGHSMLRARFTKTAQGWQQYVTSIVDTSFDIQHVQTGEISGLTEAIRQGRDSLDIESGPLVAVVLGDLDARQFLFVAVHHLVIDLVSWRILLEELENLLLNRRSPSQVSSMPFQAWRETQAEYTHNHMNPDTLVPAKVDLQSYWGAEPRLTSQMSTTSKQFVLSEQVTSTLLGSSNDAFGTRPLELMIAALSYSFATIFPDRAPPPIFNETHGREPWDDHNHADVSRTVGWFTSLCQVQPSFTNESESLKSLVDVVRATKDSMRSVERNGQSEFASHFTSAEAIRKFASIFPVEIVFNYQGIYQQLERDESLFKHQPLPSGCEPTSAVAAPKFSLFTVSVVIQSGCANFNIEYSGNINREIQVEAWIKHYESTLASLPDVLGSRRPEWTLSDVSLAFQSYADLDRFRNDTIEELGRSLGIKPEDIEDVYPCSPMQEGILARQSRDPDAYQVCVIIEVVPARDTEIDCGRLREAWKAVVRRHSLLRALLVDNVPGSSGITNVILTDPEPSISIFQTAEVEVDIEMFRALYDPVAQQAVGLQHHLSICQVEDKKVFLCFDISHAIMDAYSRETIIRDLQNAYTAGNVSLCHRVAEARATPFKNVISYLKQQRQEDSHAYWARFLEGVDPCYFPVLANTGGQTRRDEEVKVPGVDVAAIHAFCEIMGITPATIIQVAWAMVLSRYTGSHDLCFGTLTSGRDAPIGGINDIFGPLVTMLTSRVRLGEQASVEEVLRAMQSDYAGALEHQTMSLANVHNMLRLGTAALFNTSLSIQRIDDNAEEKSLSEVSFRFLEGSDPTEYDIVLSTLYSNSMMEINVRYRTSCMDKTQAEYVAESLGLAVASIITAQPDKPIRELDLTTEAEKRQLWAWNGDLPPTVDRCIHDIFSERAKSQPHAEAVCAQDGQLTYRELDEASTKLSNHLVELGTKPGDIVPVCFEKSKWMIVAVFAIMKAGAAFAPLDPNHPESRREQVLKQTGATLILTSVHYSTLFHSAYTTVAISAQSMQLLVSTTNITGCSLVDPSSLAYVIFTSGSTGVPKGVMLEHNAVATGCLGHGKAFGVTSETRFLQFAAFTFDISITEIITTLLYGGTVCIPSEDERHNNLGKAIARMQVNWAYLTPTVARLLDPNDENVRSLQSLILGGEEVRSTDCDRWAGKLNIINAYGPTECCVLCTAYFGTEGFQSGLIGKSIASVGWVVDPGDHNKLAPLGSVGELLMEGPVLARGYLNDPIRTQDAFIQSPDWLQQGGGGTQVGRQATLYKTGDLVRYDTEGNLHYVARKDNQVKVRGQRVELGEIEHHLSKHVLNAQQMAVEIVSLKGGDNEVAAFLQLSEEELDATCNDSKGVLSLSSSEDSSPVQMAILADVGDKMAGSLPSYMIPTVYFILPQLPITVSGKTDRKQLKQIASLFSVQQLSELRISSQGPKRLPSTPAELSMQQLWAQVLSVAPESIGLDDNFFRLGGDSIAAMKLVAEARRLGMQLTVAGIFRHPELSALANLEVIHTNAISEEIAAFSLLGKEVDASRIRDEVAKSCNVGGDVLEDIYPCSPLQEGLVALTSKRAGDYVMQNVLELKADVDMTAFKAAWEHMVRSTPILRTRIVHNNNLGLLQVVMNEGIQWREAQRLEEYLQKDKLSSIELGEPLARYALVEEDGKRWFVATAHHALYDGWSLAQVMDNVTKIYHGGVAEKVVGFNAFIKYLAQQDEEAAVLYWQETLSDCQATLFPPLPPTVQQPVSDASLTYECPPFTQVGSESGITTSTLIRAAWAIVASRYTNSDDVVFGATVTGRSAPIPGIETMVGTTIATVPLRLRVQSGHTISDFIQQVQKQSADMIPFEQTGLQRISKLGKDAEHACGFQTLVVVQPADQKDSRNDQALGEWHANSELEDFTTYGLVLQFGLSNNGINITASFDPRVIDPWLLEKVLGQFSAVVRELAKASPTDIIADIEPLTKEEEEELGQWNLETPPAIDRCIHDIISDHAAGQPSAPAIHAWDGRMTHKELDYASSRLAKYLIDELDVEVEDIIPLCFERSMWMTVAALAVLKAGAAIAPIDPDHPRSRHEEIFKQTKAKVVLSSVQYSKLWTGSSYSINTVAVGQALIRRLSSASPRPMEPICSRVRPDNTAYIIFTSGSTGVPKGVVMEHKAAVTGCLGHGASFGFGPHTRALQFASYTFDAAIDEMLTVLMFGGCACVPSESDRRDNLAQVMQDMEVTFAFLTPSVARLLDPSTISTLETLTLGGEKVDATDWGRWKGHTRVINGYGPAECCVCCCLFSDADGFQSGKIGKSVASVSWLVDPNNFNKLSPLGSIGELLVEGPILARGYLDDEAKTKAAFVDSPTWLVQRGRQGRLYKTGDLVHYLPDGNLVYVGRKDDQVKIRGQRVELGEVEYNLRKCIPDVHRLAVEVFSPRDGNGAPTLAAFLQMSSEPSNNAKGGTVTDGKTEVVVLPKVDKLMAKSLPSHMVPTIYFTLAELPMTASGKIDRKKLRAIGGSFSADQLSALRESDQGEKRMPTTEAEHTLQQLWSRVLNVKAETIGIDDNFFRLGGDSITAMQLSASARSAGIDLSTNDIFRMKVIAEMARSTGISTPSRSVIEDSMDTPFALTPIQELYLRLEPTGRAIFDQCVLLEMRTRVPVESLHAGLNTLVQRHSMLRARFMTSPKDTWQQYITSTSSEGCFTLQHVQAIDGDHMDITEAILQSRSSLDIENGPVMAVVLYETEDQHLLFVTIHHLVVDLVSWRFLIEELEHLLQQRELSPIVSTPFQSWRALQAEQAIWEEEHELHAPVSVGQSQLSYWGIESNSISHTPKNIETFELSSDVTSALLGTCNDVLETRPLELMIAALIHSFSTVFPDRSPPPVFNETHGREPWEDSIDLSRTVGWFTSMFPVQVASGTRNTIIDTIRATKESIRGFKRSGQSYFASNFTTEDRINDFAALFPVEIVFNYQGAYQQLERDESLFKNLPIPEGCEPPSATEAAKFSLFEISVVVQNGCACASLVYSGVTKNEERILDWMQQYKATFMDMTNILLGAKTEEIMVAQPTPSSSRYDDRALAGDELAAVPAYSLLPQGLKEMALLSESHPFIPGLQMRDVADILPVTHLQMNYITQGIKNPLVAFNHLFIDIGPQLDVDRLRDSCHKLVAHFPILRTRFSQFHDRWWQTVLHDVEPPFRRIEVNGPVPEESNNLCLRDDQQTDPLKLPTSFTLVHNGKSGQNRLIIRLSHAQYDGVCIPVILGALVGLYQQQLINPPIGFSAYLAHARKQQAESARYWRNVLRGSHPTSAIARLRPRDSEAAAARALVAERSIYAPNLPEHLTIASVVSAAWGLVLSRITGEQDVVYGQVVAGRNADIPHITEMVGPCVNIVPVRAVTRCSETSEGLITSVQEQYLNLGQADSMGWDEIIHQCTDWTSGSELDSVFLHQNIDTEPQVRMAGGAAKVKWFKNPLTVPHHIGIVSQPQGDKLKIIIAANTHILAAEFIDPLLDMIVETVTQLSNDLKAPLALCTASTIG